jgi:hypothetical protein
MEAGSISRGVPVARERAHVLRAAQRRASADALRRIDADEFGARYLPAPEVLAQRRVPLVPRWRSLAVRHPELVEQLHPALNGRIDPLGIAAGRTASCGGAARAASTPGSQPSTTALRAGAAPTAPQRRMRADGASSPATRPACRRSAPWRSSDLSCWPSFTRRATAGLTLTRSATGPSASCGGAARTADTSGPRRSQAARSRAAAARAVS